MLQCQNCGTLNNDPGGDPASYYCGACGQPRLYRLSQVPFGPPSGNNNNNALALAVAGATIGGLWVGPVGAIIGGTLGAILGANNSSWGRK
jgi:hypothetical protein